MSRLSTISADADSALADATSALDAGDLIVVPGDVCYLLAGDALDDAAVERIFSAKRRGADRALSVLVSGHEDLHHVAYGGPSVREIADASWPGPTRLMLRARPWLPEALTAGQPDLVVTVPRQAFTRALAKRFGPIAFASARRSGGALPLAIGQAREALGGDAVLYVDAGPLPGGAPSLIRAGTIARE